MNELIMATESLCTIIENQSKLIGEKDNSIAHLQQTINENNKTIINLQQKLDYFLRLKFSSSSEKLPSNQPSLFADETPVAIEAIEDTEDEIISYNRKKRGNKTKPPLCLPHIRVEHDLNEEEKVCKCGCGLVRIKEIISTQYDIVPASFRVIENVRFVYACSNKCGEKVKTAPLTPQVLPKHQVTPSFLATIAVQKFEDALPLERQVKIYRTRFGVNFTTTTFSDWMIKTSQLRLEPLIQRLSFLQMQSQYIQADETTLQVLNEEDKESKSKSYVWLKASTEKYPIVLMYYSSNRSSVTAEFLFNGFSGYLQTDGYAGYNSVASKDGVTQLGCFAHARRKFADIIKSSVCDEKSKRYAKELVAMVAKLYAIEKEIKDEPPELKKEKRQEHSRPILDSIKQWLDENFLKAQALGGAIARAFAYLNNQFAKLSVYIEDGRLNIDNNKAENHIRPIALGRKNWLFATSTKGATALCNWYSVIETAKANGLDPYAYLCHILTLLPIYEYEKKDIDDLLPWNVSLK